MINKAALIREIKKTTDITNQDASVCIDTIFEAISAAVARGERIELRGFGSFFTRAVSSKKYPNSFSVQNIVPSHSKIIFRPCLKLRSSVWNRVKN
jgi:integration host factor subunit beta